MSLKRCFLGLSHQSAAARSALVASVPPRRDRFTNRWTGERRPHDALRQRTLQKTRRPILGLCLFVSLLIAPTLVRAADDDASAFGSVTNPGSALIGIFYDLKQTQKGDPIDPRYMETLSEFIKSGWDENVINKYFRATRPVYATQVYVPNMGAGGAPEAFNLKEVVRPSQWFVIYKGQVSPPSDGTYRFVGVADDVLAVAVNGKTALVSNFGGWGDGNGWQRPDPAAEIPGGAYSMQRGDWFTARRGEPIDLDVLVGEYPGTAFGAWLMIEKQGEKYPVMESPQFGPRTVLPLFQVAPKKVSTEGQPVPFTSDGPVWTCHQ